VTTGLLVLARDCQVAKHTSACMAARTQIQLLGMLQGCPGNGASSAGWSSLDVLAASPGAIVDLHDMVVVNHLCPNTQTLLTGLTSTPRPTQLTGASQTCITHIVLHAGRLHVWLSAPLQQGLAMNAFTCPPSAGRQAAQILPSRFCVNSSVTSGGSDCYTESVQVDDFGCSPPLVGQQGGCVLSWPATHTCKQERINCPN
jgi:hypothetical protein